MKENNFHFVFFSLKAKSILFNKQVLFIGHESINVIFY